MRLPPLNALRAFEAAARHGGFLAAADELGVSRGAVSRHVKLLEDDLGTALFIRSHNGVALTPAGQRLRPVLTEAFRAITDEVAQVSGHGGALRIICPPALSIRWLFPRLDGFRAAHPEIRLQLTTDFYGEAGFDTGAFDLGITTLHARTRPDSLRSQVLFPMRVTPACAPDFLAAHPLRHPADLAGLPLLHEAASRADWRQWLTVFGAGGASAEDGTVFPNLDMALRAAVMGGGVVMADLALAVEELSRGDLVLPFPTMTLDPPEGPFGLIGPRDRWNSPSVAAFRRWVVGVLPEGPVGSV
ncbi:LysR substrate-binding domain-containing protein [Jannaschia sp. M317]|uniref:LysR substrate-binding domain-containing protein n=1 Tax=Jannaschia sp. M317 TaxID=2867011 RepID=UPI0021A30C02|nr:LysR substrate-binding domain-containing protein [Jannaschia sp. M317]UWQ18930.1 LysR family transcriptional regulator [Jannaschia sp. M317]